MFAVVFFNINVKCLNLYKKLCLVVAVYASDIMCLCQLFVAKLTAMSGCHFKLRHKMSQWALSSVHSFLIHFSVFCSSYLAIPFVWTLNSSSTAWILRVRFFWVLHWISGLLNSTVWKNVLFAFSSIKGSLKIARHGRHVETYRSCGPAIWDR